LGALVALGRIVDAPAHVGEYDVKRPNAILTLPFGNHWLLDGSVGSRAGDLALEHVHVHCESDEYVSRATLWDLLTLRRTTARGDPMVGTDAATFGAGRHFLGDLEVDIEFPNTSVVDGENGKIFRLDAPWIRFVDNGEGTTPRAIHALMLLREKGLAVLRHSNEAARRLTGTKKNIKGSGQSGR